MGGLLGGKEYNGEVVVGGWFFFEDEELELEFLLLFWAEFKIFGDDAVVGEVDFFKYIFVRLRDVFGVWVFNLSVNF